MKNSITTNLFTIFERQSIANADAFVSYWKAQFEFQNMHLYTDNINEAELDLTNLYELYSWKNGMELSVPKQISVTKISHHLPLINRFKNGGINEEEFENAFSKVSAIWKIFLRHIIRPDENPIFDQHVYRACRYLQDGEKIELENNNRLKEEEYFQRYIPFFWDVREQVNQRFTNKDIDEALWAFGKFISTYPKMVL
jgi:hypothetical protein